jgi:hypothetical protein
MNQLVVILLLEVLLNIKLHQVKDINESMINKILN